MVVVALVQHGVTNTVATLGTAATSHHLEKLYRVVQDVVFCFDGDNAGRQAAWRALEHTLPAIRDGRQAKFMFLPDGEDPDTYVRKVGAERFLSEIGDAPTLSQFFWRSLETKTDATTLDGRARLAELARPYLNSAPEGVFKDMMLQELSVRTGLAPARLASHGPKKPTTDGAHLHASRGSPGLSAVRQALALLVHDPALAVLAPQTLAIPQSTNPGVQFLTELVEFCRERPQITTGTLLELWRDRPSWPHLKKIAQWQILTPLDGHQSEFLGALQKIQIAGLELQIDHLLSKTLNEPTGEQPQQLRELMARLATSKRTVDG
jgi:DNA primase